VSVRVGQEIQALSRDAELSSRPRPAIDVVAGVLVRGDGRILIGQRPAGKHMAGAWEFPGGKKEAPESARTALVRELREELGVEIVRAARLLELTHTYPDRQVRLDFWWIDRWRGEPEPMEGQALRWVTGPELGAADLLPADGPVVAAIIERLASA